MASIRMVVDSSVFIEYLRTRDRSKTKYWNLPVGTEVYISSITVYELYMGATNESKWTEVWNLIHPLTVLPVTNEVGEEAARIYQDLRGRNKFIGHRDILIAATAKLHNLPILTNNEKHFSRVKGLVLA